MKHRSLVFVFSALVLVSACKKSEISDKPAAEVTDTTATTAATSTGATVSASVVKEKSSIDWVAGKVTRDHKGKFKNFDGSIEYTGDQPARIAFDIDLTSIESDDPKLTGHLKSPDFFDVAKNPKATFTSTSIGPAPAGSPAGVTHVVTGNLNMHGVEKAVTIPVVTAVSAEGVRTTSEFTINRHDWGISYKGAADDLIKDNVLIKLNLLFPQPPAA